MIQANSTTMRIKEEQLAALYQMMQTNNDEENAEKILDLYEKLQSEELTVSFSGHFSAGKSSMINTLLGKDILPKSPIPTSANIVKLSSGEGWARVFFVNGDPVEYKEPYDLDMIKAYSRDKDTIKRIEISTKDAIIPQGAAIIDTPGIDAADDADRLMTESALHLVDVLFYVMDYNHVQSEVNLYFLKSLQENNIPFYLIINQIDKHNEKELSFASFKESIRQTFSAWDVQPEAVFYTSLYEPKLANNQFSEVKDTLFSILENDGGAYLNIDASVQQVINKHKAFLADQYEDLKNSIEMDEDLEHQLRELDVMKERIKKLEMEPVELEQAFHRELNQTLKNAYLMPKELRDKAQLYLESEQPGFKVGLFGSKKKTELEKQDRMKDFELSLQEKLESSIQWKLRDKFVQLLRDYGITDQALMEKANNFSATYDHADFQKLLKPGAQVNGDYVLNYTNEVANDAKSKFRRSSLHLLQTVKEILEERHASLVAEYESSYQNLQGIEDIKNSFEKIDDELASKQKAVDRMLTSPVADETEWKQVLSDRNSKQNTFLVGEEMEDEKVIETKVEKDSSRGKADSKAPSLTTEAILERIETTIELTANLPGFDDLLEDLNMKKDRLKNRSFTIALFGAFSAGKSSFSNALIGERVLPVSPNPTTATVNRIHPVTNDNPHGTVIVTMKQEEDLFRELQSLTSKLSPKGETFERLLHWIEKKRISEHTRLNNMYQAYIQALLKGYPSNKENIGKTVRISLEDFATYVTDETIACYIDTIDVYYDCSITRQGITLVDTPGADSVNARHTNVAFNYIKHADAILYVTYYNHALSRADRDFLMQLGRVKEAFQLDKMFFIVNAADLAENEAELNLVTDYVDDELTKLGIRNARLYPVSSKLSLEEKLNNESLNDQMRDFEDAFYQFIHYDLAALTIESALWDIKRVFETLEHYISSISMDHEEKEKQKISIQEDKQRALAKASEFETEVYVQQIKQRIEKQLFYVIERLGIRYHDMFKEMFNPTTITANGRKANAELRAALENLAEYMRFELSQELQAVSLRLENYTLELANEVYQGIQAQYTEVNRFFTLPNRFQYELTTPDYEEKLHGFNLKDFQPVLGKYKGTKAFFVQNEKEVMKEELYTLLLPIAESFININQEKMITGYLQQWDQLIEDMKQFTGKRLEQQVENYFAMLEAPAEIPQLERNLQQLESLVEK